MITTVFSGNSRIEKSILAIGLAAWRAHEHRKVLVIDTGTQNHAFLWHVRRGAGVARLRVPVIPIVDTSLFTGLEQLHSHYQDIVIDTDGLVEYKTRTALIAAHTVVVPLCTQPRDKQAEATVVGFLDCANLFNPALRVVLLVIQDNDLGGAIAVANAGELASNIRSATVAHVVVHDWPAVRTAFHRGLTVFESQTGDSPAVIEVEAIGREVFGESEESAGIAADIKAGVARLGEWYRGDQAQRQDHKNAR